MPPANCWIKFFTFSLKIMTLPKMFNFSNIDTPKPEHADETDQADQIVQNDHLTGHATDQTFFTFSVEYFNLSRAYHFSHLALRLFSHLPDLSFFTFSVIFHI